MILLTQLQHRGKYTIRPAPHTLYTNRGRSLDFTFRLFPITHLTSLITKLAGELVGGQGPSGPINPSTKPTPTKAGKGNRHIAYPLVSSPPSRRHCADRGVGGVVIVHVHVIAENYANRLPYCVVYLPPRSSTTHVHAKTFFSDGHQRQRERLFSAGATPGISHLTLVAEEVLICAVCDCDHFQIDDTRSGLAFGLGIVKSVGHSALRPAADAGHCQLDGLTRIERVT